MEAVLKKIKRNLQIGEEVVSLDSILTKFQEGDKITITLKADNTVQQIEEVEPEQVMITPKVEIPKVGKTYILKVRQYMTKPATPEFDFQDKFNKGVPMPFRTMICQITNETRGMVYAKCHAEPLQTSTCMKCGRRLNHPVSKLYGLGPECGSHAHINPFKTEEELNQHLEILAKNLAAITWEGWIIKSAIEECEEA